jgi:hypothetical protein
MGEGQVAMVGFRNPQFIPGQLWYAASPRPATDADDPARAAGADAAPPPSWFVFLWAEAFAIRFERLTVVDHTRPASVSAPILVAEPAPPPSPPEPPLPRRGLFRRS